MQVDCNNIIFYDGILKSIYDIPANGWLSFIGGWMSHVLESFNFNPGILLIKEAPAQRLVF